jgi:DNA-binding LacI/PurR family transcriptional regulator
MEGGKRATLRTVAAELGVSAKTVSNAFRRPDQLSARLRGEILAAAARLGYPGPDPLAAGLRRGRVGAVGVAYANRLSYAFDDPVSVELLAGITSAAEGAGAGLLLLPGSARPESRVAALTGAVIDGLIVNSLADDDPLLPVAIARRLPLVVIDQPDPARLAELGAPGSPWVGIDDRSAAAVMAGHLLSLGHRRFGVICFGLQFQPVRGLADERVQATASYAVSRRRLAGFRDAVLRAGLDWARVTVVQGADSTVEEGEAGAATALAVSPRPTALLCLSDRLAAGALRTAARLGLRVPEDLSIAGFDDAPPAAGLGLTTIRQSSRGKGELATRALLSLLAHSEPDPVSTLPAELITRASTGPAPLPRPGRPRR